MKRKQLKIIRYRRYKLQQDEHNYFREQVLLFYPWRNEEDEIENSDCRSLYHKNIEIIEKNRKKYSIIGDEVIDEALEQAMEDNKNRHREEDIDFNKHRVPKEQEADIFNQSGVENIAKRMKTRFTKPPTITKEEMFLLLDTLNTLQRQIVIHILKCFKTDDLPLRLFISGSAGVGKTRVINCIYQLLSQYFGEIPGEKNDLPLILLCAPSGKAAHLIGGVTLHTAFALPITEYGGQMPELSADVANTIRSNLVDLQLLIIDEISMVGANMLTRVDTRLRQIMGKNVSFGGISVILIGDLHQLPPVKDKPIYSPPNSGPLSALSDILLWEEFKFFELTEVMRQKDDKIFVDALNNLARGKMTDEDVSLIRNREVSEGEVPKDAIRLYYENQHVDRYNNSKINSHPGQCYQAIADDQFLGSASDKYKRKMLNSVKTNHSQKKELRMLQYKIKLKYGIKYMITSNVNILDGLVNGSCGVLEHITFSSGSEVPEKVWINFNNPNIGLNQQKPFLRYMMEHNIDESLIPISRMSLQISGSRDNHYQVMRAQFPIVPAEAMTIHKSQGQTYSNVCIDLTFGSRLTRALLYVALSRVCSLSNLYILGIFKPPKAPDVNDPIICEYKKLDERRLKLSYTNLIDTNDIKIIYQNVRSFNKNVEHIQSDV
ncbi:ATP-dependent DNA helicase PIF2-like, partial [Diachasma alloeum]|uniref:ATP-dependent DNA helicase PIF2-like n=1 Tax=Diachasma alloeum TaxID=454923 RepID=UPI00073836FA